MIDHDLIVAKVAWNFDMRTALNLNAVEKRMRRCVATNLIYVPRHDSKSVDLFWSKTVQTIERIATVRVDNQCAMDLR